MKRNVFMGVFFMKQTMTLPKNEEVLKLKAIDQGICQRCGGKVDYSVTDEYYRLYCQDCQNFERVVEGQSLWRYVRVLPTTVHQLSLKFALSEEQKKASEYLLESVKNHREGYLHAVCGAGKTEILYETILYCLNHDYRVCFVIPRTDVVKELYTRLVAIFPKTTIKPLYQGHHDDDFAHLLVSTVHQLINYYQEFNLIILDEADAFPYKNNPMLNRLVFRAIAPGGSFVMMSATFKASELVYIRKNKKPYYRLPARYHRHLLDRFIIVYIPEVTLNNYPVEFSNILENWVSKSKSLDHRIMLFVPTISFGYLVFRHLKKMPIKVLNVSSQEQNRHDYIQQFKNGNTDVLITTTLLERGITIKGVDVAVIKANHYVFDCDTLVQIAGRVGRHYEHPTGEIVLFAERINCQIKAAQKYVKKMNKEAMKRGLIDGDM